MDMKEYTFRSLEEFIEALSEADITRIVSAQVREMRSRRVDDRTHRIGVVSDMELIGYKEAVIYKCLLEEINFNEVHDNLARRGIEVTVRDRNIT